MLELDNPITVTATPFWFMWGEDIIFYWYPPSQPEHGLFLFDNKIRTRLELIDELVKREGDDKRARIVKIIEQYIEISELIDNEWDPDKFPWYRHGYLIVRYFPHLFSETHFNWEGQSWAILERPEFMNNNRFNWYNHTRTLLELRPELWSEAHADWGMSSLYGPKYRPDIIENSVFLWGQYSMMVVQHQPQYICNPEYTMKFYWQDVYKTVKEEYTEYWKQIPRRTRWKIWLTRVSGFRVFFGA